MRVILNRWPTIFGVALGLFLAFHTTACASFGTPYTLNVYSMPDATVDWQEDDCLLWNDSELVCDMGLKI